jgi:carbon storage regulator CsrA
MQMITRRVNEGLVIGNDIHVTVLDICNGSVRLGILAPKNSPSYWEQTLYWEGNEEEQPDSAELLLQSGINRG